MARSAGVHVFVANELLVPPRLSKIVDDADSRSRETGAGPRFSLGADDFDALQETIAVPSNQELLTSHIGGAAELTQGDTLDAAELAESVRSAGRLREG